MEIKKIVKIIGGILLLLLIILFFIRLFSAKHLDDVSPEISCKQELLEKTDVYYVIPKFNNTDITNNPEWCSFIRSLNKRYELHGVYHTYQEFQTERDLDYLQKGIDSFESCIKQSPKRFKPPQLKISKNNKKLIRNVNLKLDLPLNQLLHKAYHCEDSGQFPNWLIDIF